MATIEVNDAEQRLLERWRAMTGTEQIAVLAAMDGAADAPGIRQIVYDLATASAWLARCERKLADWYGGLGQ